MMLHLPRAHALEPVRLPCSTKGKPSPKILDCVKSFILVETSAWEVEEVGKVENVQPTDIPNLLSKSGNQPFANWQS